MSSSSSSPILYKNPTSTILLIDIPRSLELSQSSLSSSSDCKILSSNPIHTPFPSLEPKSKKGKANVRKETIDELLLQKYLHFALEDVKGSYEGDWCLEREYMDGEVLGVKGKRKRKIGDTSLDEGTCKVLDPSLPRSNDNSDTTTTTCIYTNPTKTTQKITLDNRTIYLPPSSTALLGSLTTTLPTFLSSAPLFPLIILDPPWPNRSARRKGSYSLSYDTPSIQTLLSSIPVKDYLLSNGLVGVWITNKPTFRTLVLDLFERWDVKVVEEWIWLKVTDQGEPICELDGVWRKPWEVLVVGRKIATPVEAGEKMESGEQKEVKRRVIIGVPDLHSRKPTLGGLFEELGLFLDNKEGVKGLEVFARNMGSGWWSWGDECLKFQAEDSWGIPPGNESIEEGNLVEVGQLEKERLKVLSEEQVE